MGNQRWSCLFPFQRNPFEGYPPKEKARIHMLAVMPNTSPRIRDGHSERSSSKASSQYRCLPLLVVVNMLDPFGGCNKKPTEKAGKRLVSHDFGHPKTHPKTSAMPAAWIRDAASTMELMEPNRKKGISILLKKKHAQVAWRLIVRCLLNQEGRGALKHHLNQEGVVPTNRRRLMCVEVD